MMKIESLFPLILIVAPLLIGAPADGDVPRLLTGPPGTSILADEEEYVYEVSWSMFKLGTIRLKTFPNLHAEAYVDSYQGLPFVDLHAIQYCVMDSLLYSRGSHSLEKKGEQWWGLEYLYDFQAKTIMVDETYQSQPNAPPTSRARKDTIRLHDMQFIDGLSIGIFPRRFVHTSQTVKVPTILNGKLGNTTFYFNGKVVEEEIDALDRPVRVVKVEANTDVQGLFGMSGNFAGYFSDDSLSVPIKGTVEVLLGNVNIELVKWNRKGWNPPTR
jgi:hypothetical protein